MLKSLKRAKQKPKESVELENEFMNIGRICNEMKINVLKMAGQYEACGHIWAKDRNQDNRNPFKGLGLDILEILILSDGF